MGGRELLTRFRSWRRRRYYDRQHSKSPRSAPHWQVIVDLLVAHVPPLHKRLRRDYLEMIADGIVHLDPVADPYLPAGQRSAAGQDVEASADGITLLCLRLLAYLERLDSQETQVVKSFTAFGKFYAQLTDPREQRRVIENYLRETVSDAVALRGDLQALDRFFGFDTLRERNAYAQMDLTIQVELILWFLASAFEKAGAQVATMNDGVAIATTLAGRLALASRWQVRHAAGSALVALIRAHPTKYPAEMMTGLRQIVENDEEHPWVLATAVQAILLLNAEEGVALMERRLISDRREGNDFVFRKLAVDMATKVLDPQALNSLVTRLVASGEPSEYVRQTLVRATVVLSPADALAQLASLAGQVAAPEPSYRVRAQAYIAARQRAVSDGQEAALLPRISDLLLGALRHETNMFALVVACEELAQLAETIVVGALLPPTDVAAMVAAWEAALAAVVDNPRTPPRVTEVAAAMMEVIASATQTDRRAVRTALVKTLQATAPASSRTVQAQGETALALTNEDNVGRVLAELSRVDWGISATRRGNRWKLWRGELFGRRWWRIVHELRTPLPNKRQAFAHTVGRKFPGMLRAHPGLLDEATATTVPGERTNVDAEGSWCRHLPLVDDILDLPLLSAEPVKVVSSLGTAIITPPASLGARLRNRWRLSMRYRNVAAARLAALRATEDRERHRYVEMLTKEYGVTVAFTPHQHGAHAPYPGRVRALYEGEAAVPGADAPPSALVPAAGLALAPWDAITSWYSANQYYFTSAKENSQAALALFVTGMTSLFFIRSFQKRRIIHNSRFAMPLTIGGWGTRGKSGTERLKAGFLDGLGFDVFVKTTGCEAMFIHSAPMQQPVEIFIYRPYDKATIWEQMNQIRLASRLKGDVFLWECMALNPKYVQLLQHDWMQDDLVTLTNCYPDHEDIQGPAGYNVAQVISEFIPFNSTLVTSETSYLPLFAEKCTARNTPMHIIGERDAEFIADDFLDLFPYREHPRNIALVTKVATEIGVDADLAQYTMAKCVVPDLGVLKAYPKVKVRGRLLVFLCGNSANERTGFINNWRRMKLDAMNWETEPQKLVITVVNNRADRISRSEVFARILVRDVNFDRHVLIGTNLKGLRGFLDDALVDYLREQHLVNDDEVTGGDKAHALALGRVARELEKLRIPRPELRFIMERLRLYAQACGFAVGESAALTDAIGAWLAADANGSVHIADLQRDVAADGKLTAAVDGALVAIEAQSASFAPEFPETLEAPGKADALNALQFELARMAMRARLVARLAALFTPSGAGGLAAFRADFGQAFREMFLVQVDIIEDAGATGDQIIDRCARVIPPGSDVILMGTQNIKGTGLDFVYRWLALDKVVTCLADQKSARREKRMAALMELEAFEDHGLVDAGHLLGMLARTPTHPPEEDELAARERITAKVTSVYDRRRKALLEVKKSDWVDRAAAWAEGWVDYIDSVHRTNASRQIVDDLVARRITHGRASLEMRKLVGRIKGGWLSKSLRKKK